MSDKRWRVAVVGATGYGGSELVRLLSTHPATEIVAATSTRNAGKRLDEECPWLKTDLVLGLFEPEVWGADVIFLAQEAGFAMTHCEALLLKARVIDLSADFRLWDTGSYASAYGREHTAPQIRGAYGLPELADRREIAEAKLVANPGCYPTSALLGLMPLVKGGLLKGTPVVDAKSGVSGAGRSRNETDYLFSELSGSFKSYATVGHRHTPEIEQMVGQPVRFTPHLLPFARGLQSTIHAPVGQTSAKELTGLFRQFYQAATFVRVQDKPPATKQVLGSNRCDLSIAYDERTGHAVIMSVLDNLIKGAAGQAIQNMNLMLGLPEVTGLPLHGIWP